MTFQRSEQAQKKMILSHSLMGLKQQASDSLLCHPLHLLVIIVVKKNKIQIALS
jgi:hypothetical protein